MISVEVKKLSERMSERWVGEGVVGWLVGWLVPRTGEHNTLLVLVFVQFDDGLIM